MQMPIHRDIEALMRLLLYNSKQTMHIPFLHSPFALELVFDSVLTFILPLLSSFYCFLEYIRYRTNKISGVGHMYALL
jgi:hypothetical protein